MGVNQKAKELIIEYLQDGMKVREISKILKISISACYAHIGKYRSGKVLANGNRIRVEDRSSLCPGCLKRSDSNIDLIRDQVISFINQLFNDDHDDLDLKESDRLKAKLKIIEMFK